MKQIINNQYLKYVKFDTKDEVDYFFSKQNTDIKVLSLTDSFDGKYWYCIIWHHSLTNEIQYIVCFSSDNNEANFNILSWINKNQYVIYIDNLIYLISTDGIIIKKCNIITPLIGMFIIKDDNLLILEEDSLSIIDSRGIIVRHQLFNDLIENIKIENKDLLISLWDSKKYIRLSNFLE